jgi:hypothetical protein
MLKHCYVVTNTDASESQDMDYGVLGMSLAPQLCNACPKHTYLIGYLERWCLWLVSFLLNYPS